MTKQATSQKKHGSTSNPPLEFLASPPVCPPGQWIYKQGAQIGFMRGLPQ
jgi:hypothetical protein